jgi:hypothetical protein
MRLHIFIAVPAVMLVGLLSSCANSSAPAVKAPHARLSLRDGTRIAGTVTASSPSEITLLGDDKASRTIAMKDVKSIAYDEPTIIVPAAPGAPPPATSYSAVDSEAVHEDHYHPPVAAIRTKTYTVPAAAEISVRSEETIDSSIATEGQTYAAEVTRDILDPSGDVVIPRGSNAQIIIRSSAKGGRIRGASDLILDLASVSVGGRRYQLDTVDYVAKGRDGVGGNKRTALFTGGGAAVGAIIGAIAGGGKGAAIGAASGAGAGAGTQILTKGGSIKVPAEAVLTFKLDSALRVVAAN